MRNTQITLKPQPSFKTMSQNIQKNISLKNALFVFAIFASGALSHYAYDIYYVAKEAKSLEASRVPVRMNLNIPEPPDPMYATPELLEKLLSSGLKDEAMGCGSRDFKSIKNSIQSGEAPIHSFTARWLMLDPKSDECLKIKKLRDINRSEELQAAVLQSAVISK